SCDAAQGLVCDPNHDVCAKQTILVRHDGETCSQEAANVLVVCAPGSFCEGIAPSAPTCAPATLPEGHGCRIDPTTGEDPCAFPASCIDGQCSLPDPPLCQ